MNPSRSDAKYMDEAIRLAEKGGGWTNPNPMVGALLVKRGRIIARGFHRQAGLPHAEIEALRKAKKKARGATLYVNLEPCTHFGRTPPCVDAVIEARISRVVCAAKDPDPRVNGKGITKLRKAGIIVRIGVRAKEARALNETFYTFHAKKRPFVALKFAASLDGKLATRSRDSKWITNEAARAYARNLRSRHHAVLVGTKTALSDNPHLGVRTRGKKDPVRIVLDPYLRTSLSAQVFRDKNVIIAVSLGASQYKKNILQKRGITVLLFKGSRIPLQALLAELKKRNILSILVEGGGEILGSFLDERLVDRVYAFHAPVLIGGKDAPSVGGKGAEKLSGALRVKDATITRFGDNTLTSGTVQSS